jgi:hypothetical protein
MLTLSIIALNILISSYSEKVPLYVPTPIEDTLILGSEINLFFVDPNYLLRKKESVPSLVQNPSKIYDDYLSLDDFLDNYEKIYNL